MAHKSVNSQSKEREAYSNLVNAYLCSGSENAIAKLSGLKLELSSVIKDFDKKLTAFQDEIFQVPLSVFIAVWADEVLADKGSGGKHLALMSDLLKAKLLSLGTLKDFAKEDNSLIDEIRCYKEWSIEKREDIASFFVSFVSWLVKKTFSLVKEAKDGDRLASQKRQVSFDVYVKILSSLDLRERILAKLFYLGGNRGLEEVLSIRIEDVDLKKQKIRLSEEVFYPKHLFEDVLEYIQDRKKGFLFLGKEGERIAHTTPFRALKKVVSELNLDPDFTFRELTKNI